MALRRVLKTGNLTPNSTTSRGPAGGHVALGAAIQQCLHQNTRRWNAPKQQPSLAEQMVGGGAHARYGAIEISTPAEAEAAIERLAAAPADDGLAGRDIWLLRLRALLARAHDDTTAYTQLRDRYRDKAKTLGFEGHVDWAEAMP